MEKHHTLRDYRLLLQSRGGSQWQCFTSLVIIILASASNSNSFSSQPEPSRWQKWWIQKEDGGKDFFKLKKKKKKFFFNSYLKTAAPTKKLSTKTDYFQGFKKLVSGTSLVAQWLRIHLPMQGTWVRALIREDPTCHRATKPVRHNYSACVLEPASHNYWSLCA